MAAVTIRNLSPETAKALKLRAAENGRSTEAEMRAILDDAVRPPAGPAMAQILAELRHGLVGVDLVIERDQTPAGSTADFG